MFSRVRRQKTLRGTARTDLAVFGRVRREAVTGSGILQESEVKGAKHQDDSDIRCQSFPESVFEEQDIDRDDDGRHKGRVKYGSSLVTHFVPLSRNAL